MSKLSQINLSYHEMRLMPFFLLEPRVSLRQNIFNDKTRIENDKLKDDEESETERVSVSL